MVEKSYVCGYCGKAYASIRERTECEKACEKRLAEMEAAAKAKKAEEERLALEKEIDDLDETYAAKIDQYIKKYHKLPPCFELDIKTRLSSNGGNENEFLVGLLKDLFI